MNKSLRITFKHPDAVDEAKYIFHNENEDAYQALDEEELDNFTTKVDSVIDKFIRYGEYVTIEFNIETGAARVIPVK